jgi:hypothetical protein
VGPHRFGLVPGPPCPARILEIANQFLLLGVDRDRLLRGNQDARRASIWMRKCRRMRDGGRAQPD